MSDPPYTPFALAGKVASWDPVARVLHMGRAGVRRPPRSARPPPVPRPEFYRQRYQRPGLELWVVTQIQRNPFPI